MIDAPEGIEVVLMKGTGTRGSSWNKYLNGKNYLVKA